MKKELFCDNCGTLLEVKTSKENRKFGICDSCGFVKPVDSDVIGKEKQPKIKKVGKGIAKAEDTKGFPHKCSKCGFGEADVYDLGAPYGDESSVILFQCKKCNHVDRQGFGTSSD